MSISKSKKRFGLCLTVEKWDKFSSLSSELGLKFNLSQLLEGAIDETIKILQVMKDNGTLTIEDLKRAQNQQLQLLEREEYDERKLRKGQKRNTDS